MVKPKHSWSLSKLGLTCERCGVSYTFNTFTGGPRGGCTYNVRETGKDWQINLTGGQLDAWLKEHPCTVKEER